MLQSLYTFTILNIYNLIDRDIINHNQNVSKKKFSRVMVTVVLSHLLDDLTISSEG